MLYHNRINSLKYSANPKSITHSVSVIIPAFNEEKTLAETVKKILPFKKYIREIIIVNDGSRDNTRQIAVKLSYSYPLIRVINQARNLGKGTAIRTALKTCSGQLVLIQDADLEYDPTDYPKLLAPFRNPQTSVVYGSREKIARKGIYSNYFFYIGGEFLTRLTNFLYGSHITDEATGYKVFRKAVLDKIKLTAKGFEFCPEITAKVVKLGYPIYEVSISYHPRSFAAGKKITPFDGLFAIWVLIRERFTKDFTTALQTGLEITQATVNYNSWLWRSMSPYLKGTILEPAAGLGTISDMLIEHGHRSLILSDIDPESVNLLAHKYHHLHSVKIYQLNLSSPRQVNKLPQVDTIISVNTFEHIKNDAIAISNLTRRLKHKGKFIIFVPAAQILYGAWDKAIGHHRRYSLPELIQKVEAAGLRPIIATHFNLLGAIAWGIAKLLNRTPKNIAPWQIIVYDRLVLSWWPFIENRFRPPFGQSLLLVAQK